MIYILHGDDLAGIESFIHVQLESLGDRAMQELNTDRLNFAVVSENDLNSAVLSIPFLAPFRIVILEQVSIKGGARGKKRSDSSGEDPIERLIGLFDSIPESTHLITVIDDAQKRRQVQGVWQSEWDVLHSTHRLRDWVKTHADKAEILGMALPDVRTMPSWIQQEAARAGGQFTLHAAGLLAQYTGNNTLIARQEIQKLLVSVNYSRPVEPSDVDNLAAGIQSSNIFELVDALGSRQGRKAQYCLHRLLETSDMAEIFSMITRQFRLLIMAREVLDEQKSPRNVAQEIGVADFIAKKIVDQASRFSLDELRRLYTQLIEIDENGRMGVMALETAMDSLIFQLAGETRN